MLITALETSRRMVPSCLESELLRLVEDISKEIRNRQGFGDRCQLWRNTPKSCQLSQSRGAFCISLKITTAGMEETVIQPYTSPLANSSWLKVHKFLLSWNSQRQFEVNKKYFSDTEFNSCLCLAFWFAFLSLLKWTKCVENLHIRATEMYFPWHPISCFLLSQVCCSQLPKYSNPPAASDISHLNSYNKREKRKTLCKNNILIFMPNFQEK